MMAEEGYERGAAASREALTCFLKISLLKNYSANVIGDASPKIVLNDQDLQWIGYACEASNVSP